MGKYKKLFGLIVLSYLIIVPRMSFAAQNVEIILDASNSMTQQLGKDTKYEIANRVLFNLLDYFAAERPDMNVGLRIYGQYFDPMSTKEEVCADSILEVPIKKLDVNAIKNKLKEINPQGYTPIAYSLELAKNDFEDVEEGENVIILISDGEETCEGDPCKAAEELNASGLKLKVYTIGFSLATEKAREQLKCIAEVTEGEYFDAKNEEELKEKFKKIKLLVAEPVGVPLARKEEEKKGKKKYECGDEDTLNKIIEDLKNNKKMYEKKYINTLQYYATRDKLAEKLKNILLSGAETIQCINVALKKVKEVYDDSYISTLQRDEIRNTLNEQAVKLYGVEDLYKNEDKK